MKNIIIEEIFTKEDKEFNRTMVNNARTFSNAIEVPDRRGGKMHMNDEHESLMFKDRNYDFTSDIIEEFSRKWGISE